MFCTDTAAVTGNSPVLPRWSDWQVTASSVPSKKKDARHVEFNVPVVAGGETRLTYTVRYRWPEGVTP